MSGRITAGHAAVLAALVLGGTALAMRLSATDHASLANPALPFPDPPAEAAAPTPGPVPGEAVAVLAGGCFWGMEGVFEHVRGVKSVTAGYDGGTAATATYDAVTTETTGHAEAVRIVYDPAQVSFGMLLKVYFRVAHDPTEVEGQYPDSGHSYRSAIFVQNDAQRAEARAYIAALTRAHTFARPIATRLETGTFYPAEGYHQHFLANNPDNSYIRQFDLPKIARLRKALPGLYRAG